MASRVVLITGVGDYWGSRLAERLKAEPELRVIGLDVEAPEAERLDFFQADMRNPLLVDLFRSETVHTVCHLKFAHSIRPNKATFDVNVMGTMYLLGACAKADVRKVVLKSNTAVYGAHSDNSAFLSEEHSLRGSRRCGYVRDMLEIEAFCRDFLRQAQHVRLTTLRCASIVGPTADTPMTHFLKSKWAPVLLGFDPMMQIIHEDDVIEALTHATLRDVPGVFNIAAERVMPLSQIIALSGKLKLPVLHPLAYWGTQVLRRSRPELDRYLPIEPDYLRYSWVGDLTKMREIMGFVPHYTADEALREFAARNEFHRHHTHSATVASDEKRMRDTLERRRRASKGQAAASANGEENE